MRQDTTLLGRTFSPFDLSEVEVSPGVLEALAFAFPSAARSKGKNNHCTEMCSGSEAGSYLRLIDSCITQIKAQEPSRTCNESKEEEAIQMFQG